MPAFITPKNHSKRSCMYANSETNLQNQRQEFSETLTKPRIAYKFQFFGKIVVKC